MPATASSLARRPRRPLSFAIGVGPGGDSADVRKAATGDLLDLSPFAREIGLPLPVFTTRAAWFDACAWTPADDQRQIPQELRARIVGVLESLIAAVRTARGSIVDFQHHRIPRDGVSRQPESVTLVAERVGRDHPYIVVALVRELAAV